MAEWKVTCRAFKKVRELIHDNGDGREILRKLHEICANYCLRDWDFAEDFEDLGIEIWDVIDSDEEIETEDVDYYLGEFYDLCDAARVWLE